MSLGNLGQVIPAQNVQIFREDVQLILVSDVKVLGGRHVINTLNTRAGPVDSYQWRLREIEIVVAWTEDLQNQIESDNQLNTRSALSFNEWKVKGLNLGTDAGNDTETDYEAAVYDFSVSAPETGTSTMSIKLRIQRTAN